ncbi:MAG: hypothetical protein KDI04_00745 [Halieaceae bacterium]|nr:hypothetical protein [Halieaceae bacterium]
MSGEIHGLEQVSDTSVGGKAYGLARLVAMGLQVPPAFIIRDACSGTYPSDLDRYYHSLGSDKVAVRSSAQGEDGAEASFAGQYDTVLNVVGATHLRQAIDHCVASAQTERARSYQAVQSGGSVAGMNLVVQSMVDARVAGVVFTADPVSARRDLLIIDAVAGLGESLVSGEATPDHYGVNAGGAIVRRQLVGDTPLLDDVQIALIAGQARAAAVHEGQPLDLEWAIDQDGELFWLQARPVTTLPAEPQRTRYRPAAPGRRADHQQHQRNDARCGLPPDHVLYRVGHRLRAAAHAGDCGGAPVHRRQLAGHRLGLRPPVPQPHGQCGHVGGCAGVQPRAGGADPVRAYGAGTPRAAPAALVAQDGEYRKAVALLPGGPGGGGALRSRVGAIPAGRKAQQRRHVGGNCREILVF